MLKTGLKLKTQEWNEYFYSFFILRFFFLTSTTLRNIPEIFKFFFEEIHRLLRIGYADISF